MKRMNRAIGGMARKAVAAAALLVATVGAGSASATPLTTPVKDKPDITSSFVTVSYLHETGAFNADGWVTAYNGDNTKFPDYTFHIGAIINNDGTLGSGTLDVINNNDSADHLLTADLAALGFTGGDPTMQFLFRNTRGTLAGDFGSQAFVTLEFSGFDFAADGFAGDWSNFGDGSADTFAPAVPEPSTVSLLLLGAGGLMLHRRRRSAKQG